MFKKICVAVLLLMIYSPAYSYYLLEPTHISVEGQKFQRLNNAYLAPVDKDIEHGGAFHVNFNWFRLGDFSLFANNKLHFLQSGADGKIKYCGWRYETGLSLGNFQLFKYHWSQHITEDVRPGVHFPNEDAIILRFVMLDKK